MAKLFLLFVCLAVSTNAQGILRGLIKGTPKVGSVLNGGPLTDIIEGTKNAGSAVPPITRVLGSGSDMERGVSGPIRDLVEGGTNVGRGVANKFPSLLPTPEALFRISKDALLGTPLKVATEAINKLCSVATAGDGTKSKVTPKINVMKLQYVSADGATTLSYSLSEAAKLFSDPSYNKNWNLTVFITGWLTDLKKDPTAFGAIDTMQKAYLARGETNFVVLDSAAYIDTLYTWSAFNTEAIGDALGKALAKVDTIYPTQYIHVIGHSLGAHIAGATGRSYTRETRKLLPRITGLDPANPCFNEGESLSGLQRGDAAYVDVIHSNSGVLGKREPVGDADFYPNGIVSTQPGCILVDCAHARAWEYFAESVYRGNEDNFLAIKCNSLTAMNSGRCIGDTIPMGLSVPYGAKGNYFLSTELKKPFGRGLRGTRVN